MRKWKDRLRKDNKVLKEETKKLRELTEKLKDDVEQVKKRETSALAEVKRLKERYEDTWRDKAVLAEQISGPATLPLEILLSIAAFVAGDNNYGTLLNFCLVSKCLKEEMKPIFYETTVFNGPLDILLQNGTSKFGDVYDLTRYVKQYDSCSTGIDAVLKRFVYVTKYSQLAQEVFPNARATFVLLPRARTDWGQRTTDKEDYTFFQAQLSLTHPVRMDTLTSLIAYPVKWVFGESKYSLIKGVTSIDLKGNGALLATGSTEDETAFRNLVPRCMISTSNLTRHRNLEDSIPQLARFVPVVPKDAQGILLRTFVEPYLSVTIDASSGAEVDTWLANLPFILRRQTRLHVGIHIKDGLSRTQFQQRLLTADSVYSAAWQRLKHDMKSLGNGDFFSMENGHSSYDNFRGSLNDDGSYDTVYLTGQLQYATVTDSFVARIVQGDMQTKDETTVFEQPYIMDGAL
ncbi:hypothetical protein QFC20_006694 [Naganishia adeliensis]|uniref:Uncharacterized protein n=1 Tax=Naganishia adeliensis TaxID=92952 RepID=A0ACC2V8B3_9TREE|nr:hypothetical protein QFC20_006694 [Naganishia adeliensis]